MKSNDEITRVLLDTIKRAYDTPEDLIYDVGELDAVLYMLHWLYAFSLNRLNDLALARDSHVSSPEAFLDYQAFRQSHKVVVAVNDATPIIDEWKRIDKRMQIPL